MTTRVKLTTRQWAEIKELYVNGDEQLATISARYGLAHQSAITVHARRAGWPTRKNPTRGIQRVAHTRQHRLNSSIGLYTYHQQRRANEVVLDLFSPGIEPAKDDAAVDYNYLAFLQECDYSTMHRRLDELHDKLSRGAWR